MTEERTRWAALREQEMADAEFRAAYEAAGRAIALGEQVRRLREQQGISQAELARGPAWPAKPVAMPGEQQGISQAELARRMGTRQPAVARLEAGGVDPTLDTLERVSRALGVDLIVEFRTREPTGTPPG